MIRFLLVEKGVFWEGFKESSAHYIKQYINDIERAKKHFKGLNKGDAKKFSLAAQSTGIVTS
jgi:chloramphenicol O-acetyltransferase